MAFWSDFLKVMKSAVFKNVLKNGDYSVKKLTNKRSISTDLSSESGGSFDGSSDVNIGVKNTLPIKHGGTGATAVNDVKRNLGIPLSLTCGNTSKDNADGEGWFKVFEIPHSGWVSYQLNMVIETANTFNLHTWTDNNGNKHNTLPVEFQLILRAEDNPMDGTLDRKMPPTVYITGGNPTILNYFYIVQDTKNATSGSYELWYKNPTAYALANVFVQNISSRNSIVDYKVITIGDLTVPKTTYTAGKTAYCLYDYYSLNFPTIPIDKGGTGATNAATARANLGVPYFGNEWNTTGKLNKKGFYYVYLSVVLTGTVSTTINHNLGVVYWDKQNYTSLGSVVWLGDVEVNVDIKNNGDFELVANDTTINQGTNGMTIYYKELYTFD